MTDDEILTEAEAAEVARESVTTFRTRRYRGIGPAYIKRGKGVLYRRSAVIEWLISLEVPSGTAA